MYAEKVFAWYLTTRVFPHYFSTFRGRVIQRDISPPSRARGVRRMSTPPINRTEPGR